MMKWLMQSKPHEWISTITGFISAIVAFGTFLFTYFIIEPKVETAKTEAKEAVEQVTDIGVEQSTSASLQVEPIVTMAPKPPQPITTFPAPSTNDGADTDIPSAIVVAPEPLIAEMPSITFAKPYILQMASYQTKNCGIALDEIMLYEGEFQTEIELYQTIDNRYVVIGMAFETESDAEAAQAKAAGLASKYPDESLDQTRIRNNPNWTPFTCP